MANKHQLECVNRSLQVSYCDVNANTSNGYFTLPKMMSIIILCHFSTIDFIAQDITGIKQPFGGKVMLFSGDFRQVLPVVRHAGRAHIVSVTMKRWELWPKVSNRTACKLFSSSMPEMYKCSVEIRISAVFNRVM